MSGGLGSLNGKTGEYLRAVLALALAGLVSYYTTLGVMQAQLAVVIERERNHYDEIIRRLDRIENKVDVGGGGGAR